MAVPLIPLVLGAAKSAVGWILRLARDNPWPVAVAAALALAWWNWSEKQDAIRSLERARTSLTNERDGRKADHAAWQHQVAEARAATAAAQLKSKEIATDAQASHQALLADNAGLRDYIAGHRLQSVSSPATAAPAGATGDRGTGLPAATAPGALVATSEADLIACDADYAYSVGAYQFIGELVAAGLAK